MGNQKNIKIYILGLLCGLFLCVNSVSAEVSRGPCEETSQEFDSDDSSDQILITLRANGSVGELENGYLEARNSSALGAVSEINQKRKNIYEIRAKQQGLDISVVELTYAKIILERLPSGSWIKTNGTWSQKE